MDENGIDCPDCDLCLVCCRIRERAERLRDKDKDNNIGKNRNDKGKAK